MEDSANDSFVDDNGSVFEVESKSEAETEHEEELVEPAPVTCDLCGQAPCDREVFGEEIWDKCSSIKEQDSDK